MNGTSSLSPAVAVTKVGRIIILSELEEVMGGDRRDFYALSRIGFS